MQCVNVDEVRSIRTLLVWLINKTFSNFVLFFSAMYAGEATHSNSINNRLMEEQKFRVLKLLARTAVCVSCRLIRIYYSPLIRFHSHYAQSSVVC